MKNFIQLYSKKTAFVMITMALLQNATTIYSTNGDNQQQPATSYSVWYNLGTLGKTLTSGSEDVSHLGYNFAAIEGTGNTTGNSGSLNTFNPYYNSLADMAGPGFNNLDGSPANLNSLACICGTGYTEGNSGSFNTFNPAYNSLADICGADFRTADDSLHVLSLNMAAMQASLNLLVASFADPVLRVQVAAANGALTVALECDGADEPVTTDLAAYNTALASALALVTTAITPATQSSGATVYAQTALGTAQTAFTTLATAMTLVPEVPTSAYSLAQVQSALTQLVNALTNLQTIQASL